MRSQNQNKRVSPGGTVTHHGVTRGGPGGGGPESLDFIGPLVSSQVGILSCVTPDAGWGGFPETFPNTSLPLLDERKLVRRSYKLVMSLWEAKNWSIRINWNLQRKFVSQRGHCLPGWVTNHRICARTFVFVLSVVVCTGIINSGARLASWSRSVCLVTAVAESIKSVCLRQLGALKWVRPRDKPESQRRY